MRHCPQCGTPHAEGAQRCPACGLEVALVRRDVLVPGKASRTIMGGLSAEDLTDTIRTSPSTVFSDSDGNPSETTDSVNRTLLHGPRVKPAGGSSRGVAGPVFGRRTIIAHDDARRGAAVREGSRSSGSRR